MDAFFWADLDLRRIYTCRWLPTRTGSALLAAYRFVAGLYLFGVSLWLWCCDGTPPGLYISYLTTVGLWVTIIYFVFAFVASVVAASGSAPAKYGSHTGAFFWRHLLRGGQVLLDIALPFQPLIVIFYWATVYAAEEGSTGLDLYQTIHSHGIACAVLLVDAALSCVRLPDSHSLIALAAGIIYILWNLGYTLDIEPLYEYLDWQTGESAAAALGGLAVLMAIYFLESWALAGRDHIAQTCCRARHPWDDEAAQRDIFSDANVAGPCARCTRGRWCYGSPRVGVSPRREAATGAADPGAGTMTSPRQRRAVAASPPVTVTVGAPARLEAPVEVSVPPQNFRDQGAAN